MLRIISNSETTTANIAAALARSLSPGDVVALIGDLGTGKTRLAEGTARALGYQGRVRSPTFTLLNVYQGDLPIYHFDLYRLADGLSDLELDEWSEYFEGDGITIVEWAERLGEDLPAGAWVIHLFYVDERTRRFELTGPAALLMAVQAAVENLVSADQVNREAGGE